MHRLHPSARSARHLGAALASLLAASAVGQEGEAPNTLATLKTKAEASGFTETASLDDVTNFLDQLQELGAPVRVQSIGRSAGGRPIPMAIASNPPVSTPLEAHRTGRPIVYLQANIHGAEVEGKDAVQALLRDLSLEPDGLLSRLVLVVVPIYNIDGNEAWGDVADHRPAQNGPPRVGLRPNGDGLDLNRDCMKAVSPEMQSVLEEIYVAWDPDVVMDLHTTDGTRHGYHLTYAPPLCPDTDGAVRAFTQEQMLPEVRKRMRELHDFETIDYGNAARRGPSSWRTFGWEPRYVTNYVGLRNRIAVLSEATSYETFEGRIQSTYAFVKHTLAYVAEHAEDVRNLTSAADQRAVAWGLDPANAPPVGLRFSMVTLGDQEIRLERPESTPRPFKPVPVVDVVTQTMPVYDRFQVTESVSFPGGYLIPADLDGVVSLLLRHGIVVETLTEGLQGAVETFTIESRNRSRRPFQQRRLNALEGTMEASNFNAPPGTYLVRTAQPLGMLACHLLEARSLDGAAAWGFMDSALSDGGTYPIRRFMDVPEATSRRVTR